MTGAEATPPSMTEAVNAVDYAGLPPEVNSARMYAGAGSGSMTAAGQAWSGLAEQLRSAAGSYSSVVSGLTTAWQGPASARMSAAVAPYVAWLNGVAAQAEQTAVQLTAAVAAYQEAFAATVPPEVIAANRAQRASLVATNVFGQNTAAIVANEARYAQMWAQDAAAMYSYAGQSAAAAQVSPFDSPPRTTNPAGVATHGASDPLPGLSTLDGIITGPLTPGAMFVIPTTPQFLGVDTFGAVLEGSGLASGPTWARSAGLGKISAGMGRAGAVGGLSVPQGWTSAAPAARTLAAMMPPSPVGAVSLAAAMPSPSGPVTSAAAASGQASLGGTLALSGLAGSAMAGTGGGAARSTGMGGAAGTGGAATTANIFFLEPKADK